RRDWDLLRLLSGAKGGAARSDRRAPLRIGPGLDDEQHGGGGPCYVCDSGRGSQARDASARRHYTSEGNARCPHGRHGGRQHDVQRFKKATGVNRLVMVWCGSTEAFLTPNEVHADPARFENAMKASHPSIAPSMLYAWAAITSGVPFANGAPNLTVDIPALQELAREHNVPICGKDFKTGQTLLKTILAPGFKARMLGLNGWFSTNILGNRDGEVLDDPESFKTKEESKLGVLEYILQPQLYPELYGKLCHQVRINYYPPRGDDKEGWD